MTIELYDASNHDGLFDVLGKAFFAVKTLNTARLTTIPDEVQDILDQFQLYSKSTQLDIAATMEGLPNANESWQDNGYVLADRIRSNAQAFLVEVVEEDADQHDKSIQEALEYIIEQMEDSTGEYVDGNTVSISLSTGSDNIGDVAIAYTHIRGDGLVQENALAETIEVEVTNDSSEVSPTIRFNGRLAEGDLLSQDWPKGSGCGVSIAATDPANSLLSNGDFEDETITDTPDNWEVVTGDIGTTVKITAPEVQTVVISGTPTEGSYLLQWTNANSITRTTIPLAYNASGSTVQAALREIPGLEQITVSTTGTSPDYTHEVTFTGVAGDVAEITAVSHLGVGTGVAITITETTAGNDGAFKGKALEFDSDGAELTAIYHELDGFDPDTVYFCHLRCIRVGAAAAGEMRVEIVDGIGGSVVTDEAGNSNSHTIDVTAMATASHDSEWFAFRIPKTTDQPVYLRIRISTAISNTASVFVDEVAIVKGTELYDGGPFVAAFSGATAAVNEDEWTMTVANNRAGEIQEWFNRFFRMADKGLLLPVAAGVTGGTLIPDSVIG